MGGPDKQSTKRDKNNGILFLVAMQSHDIWIEVGSGLKGQFSDSQVQQIVDNVIIPRFRASQPDLGVVDGVHSIIGHFEGSSISQTKPTTYAPQDIGNSNFNFNWLAVFGVLGALCLAFFRWFTIRKNKARIDEYKKALKILWIRRRPPLMLSKS